MIVNFIDFLRERQQTVKNCCYIAIGAMLIWTVVGVDTHHAHTWMEAHIPGFLVIIRSCLLCGTHLFFTLVWQKWNND